LVEWNYVSMRLPLKCHPESPDFSAATVAVEISRSGADTMVLLYILTGKMDEIRITPVLPAARREELWRHTCFEAFVRASLGTEYYEFNFAPSRQWAAYRFTGYRNGMCVAADIGSPSIEVKSTSDSMSLQATVSLDRLSGLPRNARWHLGLSAVIEDRSGRRSYWALAHPPGSPDFHHADGFAHEFAPP
jgi:hypothetical protein